MKVFILSIFLALFALPLVTSAMLQPATITVGQGGDLQAALDSATCGDTVILASGATFYATQLEQPFVLKAKACTGKITIKSPNAELLPSLKNQSIAQIAAFNLPKLITKVSTPALEFQGGSRDYLIQGIEITNDSQSQTQLNNGLVFVGENSGSQVPITLANVPANIEFDRCYLHPEASDGTTSQYSTSIRAFSAMARNLTIRQSRMAGFRIFWKPGQTNPLASNAVLINKGPGPYTITDNYLEAWFGTVFTGGGPQWVTNSAMVASGSTTTQATLTNVVGVLPRVGSYIAFEASGMTYAVGVNHGQPYEWGAAKVTSVNGNTITYVPMKSGNMQSVWGVGFGGTPLTANPNGKAVWDGDRPTNILIQGNQFVKEPVSLAAVYAQYGFGPKGHLEFKVGKNITVNANTFEGYHLAFVITPRNQSSQQEGGGKEVWSTVDDVIFSNNWLKAAPGIGQVFGIQLEDETCTVQPGSNFTSQNNLYESGTKMMNIGPAQGVKFNHDTFVGNSGPAADADQAVFIVGGPIGLTIQNSIFFNNAYGFNCQVPTGCFTSKTQDHNVIIDNRATSVQQGDVPLPPKYPSDFIAASQSAVGWASNWKLIAGSPYKGKASDGKDPGCDIDALMAALGGAPSPTPTPTPTVTPTVTPTPAPSPSATPTPLPTPLPTPTPGTPPLNQCVIGTWCYFTWPSSQQARVQALGKKIIRIASKRFASVDEVFEKERYMAGVDGSRCSTEMKKVPGMAFRDVADVHAWGYTADEPDRIARFERNNPELFLEWPLRDAGLTKQDCFDILAKAGIRRSAMYDLGFKNANCFGCVKSTSAPYWNRVRRVRPDVFDRRVRQSRELGVRLVQITINGVRERIFLDELTPEMGKQDPEPEISCGPYCEIAA